MQKACRIMLVALALASLGGCSYFQFPGVYKLEIQQGNIIKQEMVDQLKPGMTRRQVKFVLGSPLVMDTFKQDRWDYLYTVRRRNGESHKERLTVFFKDDKLSHFTGDFRPSEPDESDDSSDTADAAESSPES